MSFYRRSRGFTLVELLVVIGIIALLISILLPTLSSARQSANTLKCLSNMRQIGQATVFYVNEWDGVMPPHEVAWTSAQISSGGEYAARFWFNKLGVYINSEDSGGNDTVFKCPNGRDNSFRTWSGDTTNDPSLPIWWDGSDPLWGPEGIRQQNMIGSSKWRADSPVDPTAENSPWVYSGTHYATASWYATDAALWYGEPRAGELTEAFPISTFGPGAPNVSPTKVTRIVDSSRTGIIFDGVVALFMDPARINTRHGQNLDKANFVFADGHATTNTRGAEFPTDEDRNIFWGAPSRHLSGGDWNISFTAGKLKATWE